MKNLIAKKENDMIMQLTKYLSSSGCCSRRQAEELIRRGGVTVNNKVAQLGQMANEEDEVKIDGETIHFTNNRIYIKLNKPAGYVCTNRVFKGEKNVFALLPVSFSEGQGKLFAVGRLDKESRGLVLLTNDGDLSQQLTHPKYGHEKIYQVRINTSGKQMAIDRNILSRENVSQIIKRFRQGVDIGEGDGIVRAKTIKYLKDNTFEIVLTEGKKRQIRRMFKSLRREVVDLMRIGIGKLQLGELKEGQWEHLSAEEVERLKEKGIQDN